MDHEEMRKAYLRALDVDKRDFTDVCNSCKIDSLPDSGENVQLVTSQDVYTIWYCEDCMSDQNEHEYV